MANLLTAPPDHDTAEVAFLVDDAWQGRGLGTAMAPAKTRDDVTCRRASSD